MKVYYLIAIIAAVLGVTIVYAAEIAIKPDDVNDIEVRKLEVETMVKELPVKEKQLDTKVYAGTAGEVLGQIAVDANEVYQYAKTLNEKAVKVCEDMGLKVSKQEAVKKIVDAEKERLEKRKINSEIIKGVHEILTDPNIPPDVNDPNYAYEVERNQEFMLAVMEMCDPR